MYRKYSREMTQPAREVLEALERMGIPDNVEDLDKWMMEQATKGGKMKVKAEPTAQAQGYQQPLKLSFFSGEDKPKGGETAFDLWKFDVECLMREGTHSDETIKQCVRRSLRGDAARLLKHMGFEPTLDQILLKLDGLYGTVESGETILAGLKTCWTKQKKRS